MHNHIIAIYCFCDECLKTLGWRDDPQVKMSTAEVVTTAVVAAYLFGGCFWRAQWFLKEHGYMPNMLSKGRLNRRLHQVDESVLMAIFSLISSAFRSKNTDKEYIVDSFPVPCCENCRILRCRVFQGKQYHGYSSTKKRYFFGLRIHMVTTSNGEPVQMAFAPGSRSDVAVFREMDLSLPKGARIYADKAYTDYGYEDFLKRHGIHLLSARRRNAKRKISGDLNDIQKTLRKRIETSFSNITRHFPKSINAVTARGFQLKIFFFILSYCFVCLGRNRHHA